MRVRELDRDTRRFFSGEGDRLLRLLPPRDSDRSRGFLRSRDRDLDCFFFFPLDSDLCFLRGEVDFFRPPLEDDLFLSRDLDLLCFLSRDLDLLSLDLILSSDPFLFFAGDGELEALFLDFLAGALSSSSDELESPLLPLTLVDALFESGLSTFFLSFLGLKYCGIRLRA